MPPSIYTIHPKRSCLTRLFRHLPCLENAHLRLVNCAFPACEQLQNSSCYTTSVKRGVSKNLLVIPFSFCVQQHIFCTILIPWRGLYIKYYPSPHHFAMHKICTTLHKNQEEQEPHCLLRPLRQLRPMRRLGQLLIAPISAVLMVSMVFICCGARYSKRGYQQGV